MRTFLGRPSILYPSMIALILLWWGLAFVPSRTTSSSHIAPLPASSSSTALPFVTRVELQRALQGDVSLMTHLMAEWEIEAQLLELQGFSGVQHLTPEKYVRAQRLGRRIIAGPEEIQGHILEVDDIGNTLQLNAAPTQLLPQTELAASVLLALLPPERIAALPPRLRKQQLFPKELLDQIPLDIDRHQAEKLYALHPEVAFVAHYTHASTIVTLRDQGIALFVLTRMGNFQEVQETIQKIGRVVGKSDAAELLSLFMEAGLAALDNRLLQRTRPLDEQILYLNYYTNFSAPTERHLAGQLLRRLGINRALTNHDPSQWQIALESEQIANLRPDGLIISSRYGKTLREQILRLPAFESTPAVQHQQIYLVDEAVQDSPTQFLLLAYYDLVQVLLGLWKTP